MTMQIKQIAVGDPINEADQTMVDGMAQLVYDSFTIILEDMKSRNLIDFKDPDKILQSNAVVLGAYMGLLRILSLDGRIEAQKAFDALNKQLAKIISTSRVGVVGQDNIDTLVAEVEATLASAKNNVH